MTWKNGSEGYMQRMNRNAQPYQADSTLYENFTVGVGETIDENISTSEMFNPLPIKKRNEKIFKLEEDGVIEEGTVARHQSHNPGRGKRTNFESLIDEINANYDLDEPIKTELDMRVDREIELADRRAYREDVKRRATLGGDAVNLFGGFVGYAVDPIVIASMAIPPLRGAIGVSRGLHVLSRFKTGALVEMGVAATLEPFVHNWREEIDSEYSIKDSLFNIAAAGVLGGTLWGATGAIAYKSEVKMFSRNLEKKYQIKGLGLGRDANFDVFKKAGLDDSEAEALATQIHEMNNAPDKNMDAEEFIQKTEDAQAELHQRVLDEENVELKIGEDDKLIDAAYEALPEGLYYKDLEGNNVKFAEVEAKHDIELSRYSTFLGCNGG